MTYKEMLKEAWETIKEVTATPLKREPFTWKDTFRLFRRSLVFGILRCIFGFVVFFGLLLIFLAFVRIWDELLRFVR